MFRRLLPVAALAAALALGAAEPAAELLASATNVVLTESVTLAVRVRLPALAKPHADQPPILNQRAPHLEAAFLAQDWKPGALAREDPQRLLALQDRRTRDAACFTLNNYVSDGFANAMRDPFGMLDDDFFGSAFGPKKRLFPFAAARTAEGDWLFTAACAPLKAVAPGSVTIESVTVTVPLIQEVGTRRDRFGRPVNAVTKMTQLTLRTRPLTLVVEGPPAAGRPASWCGAIGSNLTVRACLDVQVCTAGDPLVLTLDVAGATDLARVHPPSFQAALAGSAFRIDEASAKTETLPDRRRFTWRVRAIRAGTVEFPSLPFACYDPVARRYAEFHTEAIPVQVKAGAQAALGALGAEEDETDALPMPDGLVFDARGAAHEPLVPHAALVLGLFTVPPLLFLLLHFLPGVGRRLRARRAAHRRATAYARCVRVLARGDAAAQRRALREFFATRYGVNGASVTASDAQRLMAADYVPEEIARVAEALAAHDAAQYAQRGGAGRALALLLCAAGLCAVGAAQAASPDFTWRRACSLATRATNETTFAAAAAAFVDCRAQGAANPVLFENLGACSLLAGNPRAALAAFAAAERRTGETAATRRGLRAALARLKNDPRADLPAVRLLLRPHVRYALDTRLVAAGVVWAFLWCAALLPPGGLRRLALGAGMLLFALLAGSAALSGAGEWLAWGTGGLS